MLHTLFSLSVSFVSFKFFLTAIHLDSLVASAARQRDLHRLAEELESINLLNSASCAFGIIENDESLTLGLQILLGNDIDDVAELREYCPQGIRQSLELDALFQVLYIDTIDQSADDLHVACRVCNDTHVEIGVSEAILNAL